MKDEGDGRRRPEHPDREVQHVIAKSLFLFGGLPRNQRLVVRAKDFRQQRHACLIQQGKRQSQGEGGWLDRFAQVRRNTRAEQIGQSGEEKIEGAEEF